MGNINRKKTVKKKKKIQKKKVSNKKDIFKSIDNHIGVPCKIQNQALFGKILIDNGYHQVDIPRKWKNIGLKWYKKDNNQIQLIPPSFNRKDSKSSSKLMKMMTTIPHIALNVNGFPEEEYLKNHFEIIEGPICRPDKLSQLYLSLPGEESYFLELNTRNYDKEKCNENLI